MTHVTVREWGHVSVGPEGFAREQANALIRAARSHPCANEHATNILIDRHDRLVAQQTVGILAAKGCSLEILPKIDPAHPDEETAQTVRSRLVRMLDVALGLNLSAGANAQVARQDERLLDVFIDAFASQLLQEVRRGLPRRYQRRDDDIPALKGRLDIVQQFTKHAVRPDRLACQFDELESDTPLMQIMAATVRFVGSYARKHATQRKLGELRHALAHVSEIPSSRLPWTSVFIDRSNLRWEALFKLAKLLLGRHWQATHQQHACPESMTLLFPMNDLFEAYVGAILRRALCHKGIEVVEQGGRLRCLGNWHEGKVLTQGTAFQTRPDMMLRKDGETLAIIDTKWKKLSLSGVDPTFGVSQADVYQMMAYARLYECEQLMLLYPEIPGRQCGEKQAFGIVRGKEKLGIATIDVSLEPSAVAQRLGALFLDAERT